LTSCRTARSRVIDPEAIEACRELIEGMEKDILEVLANDKVDRALMHAEIDTQKAEEALKKSVDQLASNWFQTKKDAKAKREMARLADRGELPEPNGKDTKQDKRGKKRGAEEPEDGKKKKQMKGDEEESEPREDDGRYARSAARGYKHALRRGDIDEQAEHAKAKAAKKKRAPKKLSSFERKMKEIENEKPHTGKKRSKNQFKSAKKFKRR
jgi:hypothetical protein